MLVIVEHIFQCPICDATLQNSLDIYQNKIVNENSLFTCGSISPHIDCSRARYQTTDPRKNTKWREQNKHCQMSLVWDLRRAAKVGFTSWWTWSRAGWRLTYSMNNHMNWGWCIQHHDSITTLLFLRTSSSAQSWWKWGKDLTNITSQIPQLLWYLYKLVVLLSRDVK